MLVLFPIVALMSIFLFFSLPVIETLCVTYILMPILFFILCKIGFSFSMSYFTSLILIILSLCIFKKLKLTQPKANEIINSVFFIFLFITLYILNLSWADFVPMGERLRDYSILASVIKSPINVLEPWYQGITLNYYAFWYRVGAMISYLFNYEVWNTYHILSALNMTFYVTLIFVIINKYLKFSVFKSILLTAFVFPGSNFSGIKFFFSNDTNWWGPSRVIKGAITEFPTWSFVLGDIHPHFLNLLFFPFVILMLLTFEPLKQKIQNKILLFLIFLLIPSLILFNSNIWDLPPYMLIIASFIAFILLLKFMFNKFKKVYIKDAKRSFKVSPYFIFSIIGIIVVAISLYLSSRNINTSVGTKLMFVSGEVKRTLFNEFVDAFGLQLFFVFTLTFLLIKNNKAKSLFGILMLFSICFFKLAVFPLLVLLVFNLYRFYEDIIKDDDYVKNNIKIVFEVIGFSSLVLWLVPEFVYLQDGYGIDNARMNTIFKIYSANWAISYLFAFYLLSNVISKYQLKNYKILAYIIPCVIISSLCFFKLKEFRKFEYESTLKERSEGLTKVNAQFNGAKDTISKLRGLKKGVMLESTKGAYNYASHVATLSGNTSYLGWINHVQLLYKNYQDVQKRKQEIDDFYTKLSCNDRRTFLREKDILYVVLGPLEREEYGNTLNNDFYCLKNIIQYGRYNIFTLE